MTTAEIQRYNSFKPDALPHYAVWGVFSLLACVPLMLIFEDISAGWINFLRDITGLVLAVALIVLGTATLGRGSLTIHRRIVAPKQQTYLESLSLKRRALEKPEIPSEQGWTGRKQQQREWYKERGGLTYRDRERAEEYGLDAETYISNVLEDDKG
ncbi:hypothetical protein ICM05_05175 [Leucobacter sp. cx-42]|uniref:hypothetical protein n=1 Tax=unclassified Leucobacter TaxID=2621730 RepID=UPI00165D698F|nr:MULTISPECIES: hypothetical protein [unclassified Leucobacter]MBC9954039.1 hypothetical protein [Leucobacter sp. cx-42]